MFILNSSLKLWWSSFREPFNQASSLNTIGLILALLLLQVRLFQFSLGSATYDVVYILQFSIPTLYPKQFVLPTHFNIFLGHSIYWAHFEFPLMCIH